VIKTETKALKMLKYEYYFFCTLFYIIEHLFT